MKKKKKNTPGTWAHFVSFLHNTLWSGLGISMWKTHHTTCVKRWLWKQRLDLKMTFIAFDNVPTQRKLNKQTKKWSDNEAMCVQRGSFESLEKLGTVSCSFPAKKSVLRCTYLYKKTQQLIFPVLG